MRGDAEMSALEQRRRYRFFEIALPEDVFEALDRLAQVEERSRREQVRYLLRQALVQRGLLPDVAGAVQ
jgi:hypothetical protein